MNLVRFWRASQSGWLSGRLKRNRKRRKHTHLENTSVYLGILRSMTFGSNEIKPLDVG